VVTVVSPHLLAARGDDETAGVSLRSSGSRRAPAPSPATSACIRGYGKPGPGGPTPVPTRARQTAWESTSVGQGRRSTDAGGIDRAIPPTSNPSTSGSLACSPGAVRLAYAARTGRTGKSLGACWHAPRVPDRSSRRRTPGRRHSRRVSGGFRVRSHRPASRRRSGCRGSDPRGACRVGSR